MLARLRGNKVVSDLVGNHIESFVLARLHGNKVVSDLVGNLDNTSLLHDDSTVSSMLSGLKTRSLGLNTLGTM